MQLASPALASPPERTSAALPAAGSAAFGSASAHGHRPCCSRPHAKRFEGRIFKVFHAWDCNHFPCTKIYWVGYLTAPDDIGQERWDRLYGFTKCVVDHVGDIAFALAVSGGADLVTVLTIVGYTCADCGGVDPEDASRARIIVRETTGKRRSH